MKKITGKKLYILSVIPVIAVASGIVMALNNPSTAAPAPKSVNSQVSSPTPKTEIAKPKTSAQATQLEAEQSQTTQTTSDNTAPQTSDEWWTALKSSYDDDQVGCFLSIEVQLGHSTTADIATLQSDLDYAVKTYDTPCFALAKLSTARQQY